jgi:metal-responsive CopG/Arc/MetJ family transcriptional regulator
MSIATVNISFEKALLKEIDRSAREEFRTRSELIREAARRYIESRKSWKKIFAFGAKQAKGLGLQESDVAEAIQSHRQGKR